MSDLPWHDKADVSAVEALRNWCDVLLAEKAKAAQAAAVASKLQAESASARDDLNSHRTALAGAAVENEKLQKKLVALDTDLKQREAALAASQEDLRRLETELADAIAAFKVERDAAVQDMTRREQQVAKDRSQLEVDRVAHDKRVAKVREAVR